ncbi:hypothetical protein GCM10028801_36160 [Nocardioides maradonensis]
MSTCTALTHKTRKPCKREAVNGTTVCEIHGGTAPQTRRKAEIDRAARALDAMIEPIPLTDPEANPATGLYNEYRRAVARVRFLENLLTETTDAEGLVWSKTKEEQVGATEWTGTNVIFEARSPVLVDLLQRERRHLLEITTLMSKNAFKEADLAIKERSAQYVYEIVMDLVPALGRKVDDPRVRRALGKFFSDRAAAVLPPPP